MTLLRESRDWSPNDVRNNYLPNEKTNHEEIVNNLKENYLFYVTQKYVSPEILNLLLRGFCSVLFCAMQAVERDKGKKGKISKKRKKGKKGSKKGKKKKDKDLTPDRTTESLFEEMILNGIIKQYPKVGHLKYHRVGH